MQEKFELQAITAHPSLPLEKNTDGLYPLPTMRCGVLPYYIDKDNQIIWGCVESNRVGPVTITPPAGIQDIIAMKDGQRFHLEVGKPFPDLPCDPLKGFIGVLFRSQAYQDITHCLIENGFNLYIESPLETALHETEEEHGVDLQESGRDKHLLNSLCELPIQKLSGKQGATAQYICVARLNSSDGVLLNNTTKIEKKIRRNLGRSFYEKGCWGTLDSFKSALAVEKEKFSALHENTHYSPQQIELITGVLAAGEDAIEMLARLELLIRSDLETLNSPQQPAVEAAGRVRSCHAYLSTDSIDALLVEEQRQKLADSFLREGNPSDDEGGTCDPIVWCPSFEYVSAIHIEPRDRDSQHQPKLVLLFSHDDAMKNKIFTCYRDRNESLAKIMLSKGEESYPDDKRGSVRIGSIHSRDGYHKRSDFRYGSFLIQLAIEYSFQQGYEGRVDLFSTNGSGKFYFKLGFLPESLTESSLERFQVGPDVDGGSMYLPEASIEAWKERIVKHPIILSQQEIDLLITNHDEAKQRNLNKRLEGLLDGNSFPINSLIALLNEGADINAITNGYKALHILIDYNHDRHNDSWIETLVKAHHADINIKNPANGRTPLHALLCERPDTHVDFVKWLVSLGADVNTQDNDGQTLLQAALCAKNSGVIQYLKSITSVVPTVMPPNTRCSIRMQVLSGFMVALGVAAVAIAFTMLNAATFGTVGVTVACIGLASLLAGCGFFKKSWVNCHTDAAHSIPIMTC